MSLPAVNVCTKHTYTCVRSIYFFCDTEPYKKTFNFPEKNVSHIFWKNISPEKIPRIFRNFFSPGGNFRKNFPRGFSGDPRENFRKFPKFPEIPGKFRGVFGFSRLETRITPLKFGGFFPEKGGSRKKFPGFPEKVSPRKFPEIPGIPWNFPPNFPGGPRGGPSDVSG